MQKPSTLIGQCTSGHDVFTTRDLNGDIDGGTVGTKQVPPLPDGKSKKPIIVACDACVKLINSRIESNL